MTKMAEMIVVPTPTDIRFIDDKILLALFWDQTCWQLSLRHDLVICRAVVRMRSRATISARIYGLSTARIKQTRSTNSSTRERTRIKVTDAKLLTTPEIIYYVYDVYSQEKIFQGTKYGHTLRSKIVNENSSYKQSIKYKQQLILMKVNLPMENPFHRPTLFRNHHQYSSSMAVPKYESFKDNSSHLPKSQHYHLNIWSFRNDYNNNFIPLHSSRHHEEISSFEKTMMINSVTSRKQAPQNNQTNLYLKYSRIEENPFLRKNLLVNKEDVELEIQKDLNNIQYQYIGRAFGNNQSGSGQRPSINNSTDYNNEAESRQSGNRQIVSNNGSLIMNLIDKEAISNHIIKTFMPADSYKDVIEVRGKKFSRCKVHPH